MSEVSDVTPSPKPNLMVPYKQRPLVSHQTSLITCSCFYYHLWRKETATGNRLIMANN